MRGFQAGFQLMDRLVHGVQGRFAMAIEIVPGMFKLMSRFVQRVQSAMNFRVEMLALAGLSGRGGHAAIASR